MLQVNLQVTTLKMAEIVHQFEDTVRYVYFPTTALISLLTVLPDHDPVEAMTVGREGFVGTAITLGVDESPHRAICQMPGDTLRTPVRPFLEALTRSPNLTRLLQRYSAFLLHSAGLGIACNAVHTIEARASRWLLITHDQAARDEFPLTQEFWASMLGARRQTVTVVAGELQSAGMIRFRRGVIVIRNRARLEESSCVLRRKPRLLSSASWDPGRRFLCRATGAATKVSSTGQTGATRPHRLRC